MGEGSHTHDPTHLLIQSKANEERKERTAFSALDTGNGVVPLKDLAEYLGVSESTTKRDLKNLPEFLVAQGNILKKPDG